MSNEKLNKDPQLGGPVEEKSGVKILYQSQEAVEPAPTADKAGGEEMGASEKKASKPSAPRTTRKGRSSQSRSRGQVKPAAKKEKSGAAAKSEEKNAAKKNAKRSAERIETAGKSTAKTGREKAKKTSEKSAEGKGGSKSSRRGKAPARKTPVRVISLGGLNEIGKNITVYECGEDMFIVDCGLSFPDEDMMGVDLVIPDFTYLEKNAERIRGIVLTHGHEDHIGALPYLLKRLNIPVYGTRLTLGLVEGKLREHGILKSAKLHVVKPGDRIPLGCMTAEVIRVNHSIPDAVAFAIHTPAGVIIQTGDFKIDYTPIEGEMIDLARFGELGNQGVLALLCDSTNAEKPGSTMSERKVGESFEALFNRAEGRRIIIATFASNIHRVQQIIDMAVKTGRKVAVSGRSMVNVVGTAIELGYLKVPEGVLVDIDLLGRYPQEKMILITTGSQGEPMSALSRMAMSDHRKVEITPNDFIIISATPIPGNEKFVGRVVNELMRLGAEVIYEKMYEVHVSGHACQDEIKLMLGLTKPKYFVPVHGEYKHLKKNEATALSMGMDPDHIIISDVGRVMETDGVDWKFNGVVPSGRVMVDGLGVGDVGSIVLRDRKHLGEDGLIVLVTTIDSATGQVVSGPDIVSRGFVYVREAEELMDGAKRVARQTLEKCEDVGVREWGNIKTKLRDALGEYLYQRTKRKPMILPVIMEV